MIEVNKSKQTPAHRFFLAFIRILCLLLPIIFAFGGYFLAPCLWTLLNHNCTAPEYFRFICAIVLFLLPTSIIFVETRKLNPIIKITITDKD